ncbi:MAG: CAAX protease [Rhodoferax ferrireducens]|uniref:CAAX protease n=1 Tax=Rhodoferax ferrireducens TaxID=192843 RepID=A0A1W9KRJ9_9BURK|nr:MAG: CAAX protease [Rhodoferax ferrireducens]
MPMTVSRRHASSLGSQLLAFFVLTFAWSWSFWLMSALVNGRSQVLVSGLFIVGGFGPGFAAVAVVGYSEGLRGLRQWLTRCLQWQQRWLWMALAFFFPMIFMGLALAAHVALGGTLLASPAAGHLLLAVVNFPLVFLVGGPLGEEFGWRGYALPLMQQRLGWRATSLLLGVVWAVWHLPLFWIAGTAQSHMPAGLFLLSVVASSVTFAWLFNRSNASVLPCLVLHTAVNAWATVIPFMVKPDGSNLRPFQFAVGLLVVTAMAMLFTRDPAAAGRGSA